VHETPSTDRVDDWGKSAPTVSAQVGVQSELELDLAGVDGVAAGVVVVLDLLESLDLLDSDDEESVEVVALDDEDFDVPPRLSVL
jgi:hypothetical protein